MTAHKHDPAFETWFKVTYGTKHHRECEIVAYGRCTCKEYAMRDFTAMSIDLGRVTKTVALNMHDFQLVRKAQLDGCTLIYCGRGSPWGNPFIEGKHGNREQVIARHRAKVLADPAYVKRIQTELTGKGLLCHCKPAACHCDLYVQLCDDRNTLALT